MAVIHVPGLLIQLQDLLKHAQEPINTDNATLVCYSSEYSFMIWFLTEFLALIQINRNANSFLP